MSNQEPRRVSTKNGLDSAEMAARIGRAVLSVVVIVAASASNSVAQNRRPIIDMHMHACQPGTQVELGVRATVPCQVISDPSVANQHLEDALEAMDRYDIVKGFLSAMDYDRMFRWVAAAPDRFIPGAFIREPGNPSIPELRRGYTEGRLEAMGEIGTQYTGFPPNAPELEPYFALAEELDLPVLIHTAGLGAPEPGFRVSAGNPLLLEDVLVRHPGLRLYVENAGYPFTSEMIAMMMFYPDLYADVSTITWLLPSDAFHQHLSSFVRAGLGNRVMFGTDLMQDVDTIRKAIQTIESASYLSEKQKRDIFHNNAARFLRLSEEQMANPENRALYGHSVVGGYQVSPSTLPG